MSAADLTPKDDRPPFIQPPDVPEGMHYEQVFPPGNHDTVPPPDAAPLLDAADVANAVESTFEILALFMPRADDPSLWILEPGEVSDIAAPLTRITVRRPWLAAVISSADLLVITLVLGKVVGRRVKHLRQWAADQDLAAEDAPEVAADGL